MLRIPIPFTEAFLLLSPRWSEQPVLLQGMLLLACVLGPVFLLIWLYLYELRVAGHRGVTGLLILRLGILALILILILFQPIAARTHVEILPGRVLVAVDGSASMEIPDPQRRLGDKLRLARVLKIADELVSEAQLEDWAKQCDESGAVSQWGEGGLQAEQARREALAEVVRRVDALTRSQIAERLLRSPGAGLIEALQSPHEVDLVGFSGTLREGRAAAPEELFGGPGKNSADAALTDLRLPLVRASERGGPDAARVLGVVLLTDGQHNAGSSPVKKAMELGEQGIPIYPVPLGPREAPPDVGVVSVKAPPAVFRDVDTQVEARVKVSGMPGRRTVVVRLERPGQEPLEEAIAHDGNDRLHTVRFQTRLDRVGTQALAVSAKPVEGEARTDNNRREALVQVTEDRAKVLVVDGEARWEYHYLASALQRDRTVEPQSVVFLQPRIDRIPEEELRKMGGAWRSMPAGLDALAGYDAIILGDVTATQFSINERQRLEKYVADRGGSLIVAAGKRAMPLGYAGPESPSPETEPLLRLLPIEVPQVVKPTSGFRVTLTPEGKTTPFLQMESEPERSVTTWSEFPKHFWGVVGRAKPGASVLATVDLPGPASGEEAARGRALIARQNYGFGRVLYVGLDSTWRWRYGVGDVYHHRFWGQVIRWAASDKPLVTGNEYVRFGTRDAMTRPGQDVDLVVRLSEEAALLPGGALAGARVLRVTEKGEPETVAVVPLTRREAQPRVLEGKLRDLPSGSYQIELAIPDLSHQLQAPPGPDGKRLPLRAGFRVAAPEGEELVELATNWSLLEDLAARSNGRVFAPDEVAGLRDVLARRGVTREERIENRLWQWWVTLIVILVALTLEWMGRKWMGLP